MVWFDRDNSFRERKKVVSDILSKIELSFFIALKVKIKIINVWAMAQD